MLKIPSTFFSSRQALRLIHSALVQCIIECTFPSIGNVRNPVRLWQVFKNSSKTSTHSCNHPSRPNIIMLRRTNVRRRKAFAAYSVAAERRKSSIGKILSSKNANRQTFHIHGICASSEQPNERKKSSTLTHTSSRNGQKQEWIYTLKQHNRNHCPAIRQLQVHAMAVAS